MSAATFIDFRLVFFGAIKYNVSCINISFGKIIVRG